MKLFWLSPELSDAMKFNPKGSQGSDVWLMGKDTSYATVY